MASTAQCPEVGLSNIQAVFAVIEDVEGIPQKPTAADFILPNGQATLSQTPDFTTSTEMSPSLNVTAQFQNATPEGTVSFPMYLRVPDGGEKMQGHSAMLAAMGSVQEPNTATAELEDITLDASATTLNLSRITAGRFPPRGVVTINNEDILYTGVTEEGGVIVALTGLVRGYNRTTAAEHAADDVVTLKSRVYFQEVCRHTLTVWIQNDHTVTFGTGARITNTTFDMSNSDGQKVTFEGSFKRMGWAGRSYLSAAPSGAKLTVKDKNDVSCAGAYTEGAYVKNTTRNDDNSGAGYKIISVDVDAGTVTLASSPVGWQQDDQIDAWLPAAEPIGEALESRSARVFLDGKSGRLREGSISMGTPVERKSEIGDEYPSIAADTKREITITLNAYFRAEDAKELYHGYKGYEAPVDLTFGEDMGKKVAISMPRVKRGMPTIGVDGAMFTLDRTGTVMGTKTSVEDALFVVQE